MHSAFLWCSCHYHDSIGELASLIKPRVNPNQIPEFFWMHMKKDVAHLSRVTGKGLDESVVIVHLVLRNIMMKSSSICESVYEFLLGLGCS